MRTETASVAVRTPAPKRGTAWKITLILIPLVTAALLFWLRQVQVSATVDLIFRETDKEPSPFDGQHIQITLVNFSGPYRKLLERGGFGTLQLSDPEATPRIQFVDPKLTRSVTKARIGGVMVKREEPAKAVK